jgi:hypothetical protein
METIKSPQQAIFDAVFLASLQLGYDTYDFLPPKGAKYPFVYIGEQFDQDRATKSRIIGRVQQTIHIYADVRSRRTMTDMMNALKVAARQLNKADGYHISIRTLNAQARNETAGTEQLKHGIIELDFQFN